MIVKTAKQKRLKFLFFKACIGTILLISAFMPGHAQCFSSANPIGGSANLLVLDKNTFRFISFYRYALSNYYLEGHSRSEFDQVNKANYNYFGTILAFGLFQKITLESEWGYYGNKTYIFSSPPGYSLKGSGFYNTVISGKFRITTDYAKRFYISGSLGAKIPLTFQPREDNGITLPVDLQPSTNAFGGVAQLYVVKENSESGMRYFLISRYEYNLSNKNEYQLGHSIFSSIFISKHLPDHWIPGDWTTIIQLRNEVRTKNKREGIAEESTGGCIFYISPQVNYSIQEIWNVSIGFDIPVFQYFNGTQLANNYALTISFSRDFMFIKK